MTQKQLLKTLQFSSPRIIYIVTWDKKLKAMKCPFKVRVIKPVNGLEIGQELHVDQIWTTDKLDAVFEVNGELYQYYYFDIGI
jgi:hypothetical protein